MDEKQMEVCALCGALNVQTVLKHKIFGETVIENVPLYECATCGECYYDPAVSIWIDEALSQPRPRV